MQKKLNKKDYSSQNDGLPPGKKRRIVLTLLSIYLLFSLVIILFGQKMAPLVYVCCIVPPLLLAFVLAMFAFRIDGTSRLKKAWQVFKVCSLITILYIFTLGGQTWYKNFHLNKYRKVTSGLVTDVTYDYSSKSSISTYYVEVRFNAGNVPKQDYCTYEYQKYDKGDSVKIAYSYEDPDFWEIEDEKK